MNVDAEAMDRLMRNRRSVRGFRSDRLPHALMKTIFQTASLAPSNCNVQPWSIHIVSGESAKAMRTALEYAVCHGEPLSPDFPLTTAYLDQYRTRQIDAAKALFSATGIARDDREARDESMLRNFRFFDAPHAAFFFMPAWAGWREAADVGMYIQSLMLTMTAYGVGSCAQGALSHHAAIVRRQLGVPESMRLLLGMSFGYEDIHHPSTAARTVRAGLDETHIFHN